MFTDWPIKWALRVDDLEISICWYWQYILTQEGFPHSSVGKESGCNAGDPSLIPGLGRAPGEGKSYPLQYSGLENSMDTVHGRKDLDTTEQLSRHFIDSGRTNFWTEKLLV